MFYPIKAGMTVAQQADMLYKNLTYDTALPVSFIKQARKRLGRDVRGHMIWLYAPLGLYSGPAPITLDGVFMLSRLAQYKELS